jgi:hypothetical protein
MTAWHQDGIGEKFITNRAVAINDICICRLDDVNESVDNDCMTWIRICCKLSVIGAYRMQNCTALTPWDVTCLGIFILFIKLRHLRSTVLDINVVAVGAADLLLLA